MYEIFLTRHFHNCIKTYIIQMHIVNLCSFFSGLETREASFDMGWELEAQEEHLRKGLNPWICLNAGNTFHSYLFFVCFCGIDSKWCWEVSSVQHLVGSSAALTHLSVSCVQSWYYLRCVISSNQSCQSLLTSDGIFAIFETLNMTLQNNPSK